MDERMGRGLEEQIGNWVWRWINGGRERGRHGKKDKWMIDKWMDERIGRRIDRQMDGRRMKKWINGYING